MNYIIVKGGICAGKAKTINEVSRRLQPEKITRVIIRDNGRTEFLENIAPGDLADGTYLLRVKNKNILVVAGAPTQQRKSITAIMGSLHTINIEPDFALVAMSGLERLKDFATSKELVKYGRCIYETKIWRIPSNAYDNSEEWKKRISYLTAITLHNL